MIDSCNIGGHLRNKKVRRSLNEGDDVTPENGVVWQINRVEKNILVNPSSIDILGKADFFIKEIALIMIIVISTM